MIKFLLIDLCVEFEIRIPRIYDEFFQHVNDASLELASNEDSTSLINRLTA